MRYTTTRRRRALTESRLPRRRAEGRTYTEARRGVSVKNLRSLRKKYMDIGKDIYGEIEDLMYHDSLARYKKDFAKTLDQINDGMDDVEGAIYDAELMAGG